MLIGQNKLVGYLIRVRFRILIFVTLVSFYLDTFTCSQALEYSEKTYNIKKEEITLI